LLDGAGGHAQHVAAEGDLQRLEIREGSPAYEGFDLREDFGVEGRGEAPFLAAWGAASWASAQASHAAQ